MKRFLGAALACVVASVLGGPALADDKDATAVLDKAVAALGGEGALAKAKAASWKAAGTINFGDNENEFTIRVTIQGLDRHRSEFEGEFNGNAVKVVSVLDGGKGWRKFGDDTTEMDEAALANEKRNAYLQVVPITILPLKGKDFKVEAAGEEKVGDKPAAVVKATGPDGKGFTLYFDKQSGLLVKQVATVAGFGGEEAAQETTFADYKDFGGIKKATKIEAKRDGTVFLKMDIADFKALDKAEPDTFAEPK